MARNRAAGGSRWHGQGGGGQGGGQGGGRAGGGDRGGAGGRGGMLWRTCSAPGAHAGQRLAISSRPGPGQGSPGEVCSGFRVLLKPYTQGQTRGGPREAGHATATRRPARLTLPPFPTTRAWRLRHGTGQPRAGPLGGEGEDIAAHLQRRGHAHAVRRLAVLQQTAQRALRRGQCRVEHVHVRLYGCG